MTHQWPRRGTVDYLQLPAHDIARAATFYADVLGWSTSDENFEAPNLIGQWVNDRRPDDPAAGPLLWLQVDDLYPTLARVESAGGAVVQRPYLDHGERWLVEIDDPAGNRLGLVAPVRAPQPQTLLAVTDVEAASSWYQALLGLTSDHGGPEYERLLAGGTLVLQLHRLDVAHHHGTIGDPERPRGNGVLVWFGEVSDFDDVVTRAATLGAEVVREPHRNPPEGGGNGPGHRELWVRDLDGYVVVVASPDGEAWELATS
ncbi:VOC family protein [Microlunatus ginsengisoli]|uniref:VOC domain-containing protein n=1 Tax=Microlunatus ginsengisoli TaxID=363863 RepID=A0ABP7ADF5_9ACTN